MAHLLLELLSEEIPAHMQRAAAEQLNIRLCDVLARENLVPSDAQVFSTPRRIAVLLAGLPARLPARHDSVRGPRRNAPKPAIDGFLRKHGARPNALTTQGEFYMLVRKQRARALATYLGEHLPAVISELPWPKSMRWGSGNFRWVRPLRNILCLLDDKVVRCMLEGLVSNAQLYGHAVLAPAPKRLATASAYERQLKQQKVLVRATAREAAIAQQLAKNLPAGTHALENDALLKEITGLVEWPCVLIGDIEKDFHSLPTPLLRTVLETHQRYICLANRRGTITHYAVIANHLGKDRGKSILRNNANVLRARLLDARFFVAQDEKRGMESMRRALADITFYKGLGTMAERSERLRALAGFVAGELDSNFRTALERAGDWCKADLVSDVVREFPGLQGIMGAQYARVHKWSDAALGDMVAHAIAEHYAPRGANDALPETPAGSMLAVAERLDMLAGFWSIDIRPTSTKDPYALRRAALGLIRIFGERRWTFDIGAWFAEALKPYLKLHAVADDEAKNKAKKLRKDFIAFLRERLGQYLRDQKGVRTDVFAALTTYEMTHLDGAYSLDIPRTMDRAQALQTFLSGPNGRHLFAAYVRAHGILRDAGTRLDIKLESGDWPQQAQTELYGELMKLKNLPRPAEYAADLLVLADLRPVLDRFFDTVLVNDDDQQLRARNHQLLAAVIRKMQACAGDLSRIDASAFA